VGAGFACYFTWNQILAAIADAVTEINDYAQARAAAVLQLQCLDYSGDITLQGKLLHGGLVRLPVEAAGLVADINKTKAALQDWHQRIRATMPTEKDKTDYLRHILKLMGRPLLNLDLVDARLICLEGAVQRVNWNLNITRTSRRSTVAAAIAALENQLERCSDVRRHTIEQELMQLRQWPAATPVAQRLAQAVVPTLKYRARVLAASGEVHVSASNSTYPLFYTGADSEFAELLPRVRTPGAGAGGGGRPVSISDKPLSFLLPNWFWYLPEQTTPEIPVAATKRRNTANPVNGLWLGTVKDKPKVFVGCKGLPTTSISIERHGWQGAWQRGVDKLIAAGGLTPERRTWALSLCPPDPDDPA
jgi:hypothetical protein